MTKQTNKMELKKVENRMLPFINFVNKQLELIEVNAINYFIVIDKCQEQMNLYMTFSYVRLKMETTDFNTVLHKLRADKNIQHVTATCSNLNDKLWIKFDLNPDIVFDQDFIEKGEYKKIKNRINLLRGLKIRAGKNQEIKDYILEGFPVGKNGRFADLMRDDEDYRLLFQRYIDYFYPTKNE